jgi:hypothetical protein
MGDLLIFIYLLVGGLKDSLIKQLDPQALILIKQLDPQAFYLFPILSILILFTSTKVGTSNAAADNIKMSSNHYSPPVIEKLEVVEKVEVTDSKNSKVIDK